MGLTEAIFSTGCTLVSGKVRKVVWSEHLHGEVAPTEAKAASRGGLLQALALGGCCGALTLLHLSSVK